MKGFNLVNKMTDAINDANGSEYRDRTYRELEKEYLWMCPVCGRQIWGQLYDAPMCVHIEEKVAYKMIGCYEASNHEETGGIRISRDI